MKANPLHRNSGKAYSDEQVIDAILDHEHKDHLILKWFLNKARDYTIGYLQKQYPNLRREEWDVVFANTNLKLFTRLRKGMTLNEGTSLTTYYTGVAKFAALDFVRDRQDGPQHQEVEERDAVAPPEVHEKMEQAERIKEIRQWLYNVVQNEEQVNILLMHARGFSYQEMLDRTSYKSEGACRNAMMKGKKKISAYLLEHPEDAKKLKTLLTS